MTERRRLALLVGLFVIAALGFAAASLLTLGSRAGLLADNYRLVTYFENVQGLLAGAPVRLAGKDVGTVESVGFAPFGSEMPPVRVVMQLDRDVQERVRSDSVATIGTIGLLGDRYVEIRMGTPQGEVLEAWDQLPSVSPMDLTAALEEGTRAIDNIAQLTENVNRVVEDFGETMGGRRLAEAIAGLTEIVREIQEGEGLLHGLIYEEYEGSGVESLERTIATLEDIMQEIAEGEGLANRVIYEPVPEGEDPLRELDATLERMNRLLAKVEAGEGTLGLLLNDPGLYEDLRELLGGAQRSFVVRSLIRLSTEGS